MEPNHKVFRAEFGNPKARPSLFGGSSNTYAFIMADDYNQAAAKAELYLDTLLQEERKCILDDDGSLKDLENSEPQLIGLSI